jgi:hypothetical protein
MLDRIATRKSAVACGFALIAIGARAANPHGPGNFNATPNPLVASVVAPDAGYVARWVIDNADNHNQPFAIVDKRGARLYLFSRFGELIAVTPVLLGLAPGDEAISDIAKRAPSSLTPSERTTPSGRFASQPGHNNRGEDIVWIDYDASLAIHRLRPAPPSEHRVERISSPRTDDKRISFGCVVVPVPFYDQFIAASLGQKHGVVYVLPETRSVQEMLGELELARHEPSAPAKPPTEEAVRAAATSTL